MSLIQSFSAVSDPDAQLLILGSMPGTRSLAEHAYYAHPQNCFWRLMHDLLGIDQNDAYASRLSQLLEHKIALWDVLNHCRREGSLDSNIDRQSERANDFVQFLPAQPKLTAIVFNGKKAFQAFTRHVLKTSPALFNQYSLMTLPSTSPANASVSYEQKRRQWASAFAQYIDIKNATF